MVQDLDEAQDRRRRECMYEDQVITAGGPQCGQLMLELWDMHSGLVIVGFKLAQ